MAANLLGRRDRTGHVARQGQGGVEAAEARQGEGGSRFETAAGHALDALEITPAIPEAHHLLGVALAWLGEWDDARQSLDLAIQFDPEATHSHRFAALVAEALGDAAAAEDHAAKARTGAAPAEKRPFGAADLAAQHGLRTR
jgi:tetratricopeptide (TPR) repeat protein